jgi:hypothetical protein
MVGKNDSFDSVTIEIENLIEEISEKRSNNNSSIGFL